MIALHKPEPGEPTPAKQLDNLKINLRSAISLLTTILADVETVTPKEADRHLVMGLRRVVTDTVQDIVQSFRDY